MLNQSFYHSSIVFFWRKCLGYAAETWRHNALTLKMYYCVYTAKMMFFRSLTFLYYTKGNTLSLPVTFVSLVNFLNSMHNDFTSQQCSLDTFHKKLYYLQFVLIADLCFLSFFAKMLTNSAAENRYLGIQREVLDLFSCISIIILGVQLKEYFTLRQKVAEIQSGMIIFYFCSNVCNVNVVGQDL